MADETHVDEPNDAPRPFLLALGVAGAAAVIGFLSYTVIEASHPTMAPPTVASTPPAQLAAPAQAAAPVPAQAAPAQPVPANPG